MRKLIAGLLSLFLGLASPALAQQPFIPATTGTIAVAAGALSITRIVTAIPGKQIYITAILMIPVATSAVTLSYGTGTNCNTGTTALTGVMTFSAGQTLSFGDGYGAVLVVPPGNDLCLTIATAGAPGSIAYSQF